MKKKNILITGGAGYLGSMMATYLVEEGHNVTIIDKMVFSKTSLLHLYFYKNFKFDDYGGKEAKVIMAEINNLEEHTLNNMINGGELVRLTIEALAYTELRDPIIGFILKDNKGQTLLGDNTYNGYSENSTRIVKAALCTVLEFDPTTALLIAVFWAFNTIS